MKYLCLAYEEERKLNELTLAEWHALRDEVLDYVRGLEESGHLLAATPLQSATTAAMVRVRDGAVSVTDGPFAETKEQLAGFYMVEARDLNEAVQIASRIPPARIGSVEVRPVRPIRDDVARAAGTGAHSARGQPGR
jgi:hypothetical protein